MCTRFVYRGDNIITGFNFDIDIVEWNHKVINTKDCFYIGIMRPDGMRHSYHGVNRNGNVGTLLYVHGNLSGTYQDSKDCITIADLVEKFIQAEVSFDDVLQILKERKIVYAADATMQAMLSDKHGRTLVVEPGIGWREDEGRYSLITNYSILAPESTRPFVMPEDDRYEKASKMLNIYGNHFTVNNAFSILQAVCQEGIWATRVSFVYSAEKMRFIMFRIIIFHRLESMSFRIYRSMKNYRIKDNLSVYKWLLDSLFKKRCKN